MDFVGTLESIEKEFSAQGMSFGLIGGLALAFYGVQRATMDIDFLILIDDIAKAHQILEKMGYERQFHSQNVSHYKHTDLQRGRIDFLHAQRPATRKLLKSAEPLEYSEGKIIPIISREGIIGLKAQALNNDPSRLLTDLADIKLLLEQSSRENIVIDWEEIESYLKLFSLEHYMKDFKDWYESA